MTYITIRSFPFHFCYAQFIQYIHISTYEMEFRRGKSRQTCLHQPTSMPKKKNLKALPSPKYHNLLYMWFYRDVSLHIQRQYIFRNCDIAQMTGDSIICYLGCFLGAATSSQAVVMSQSIVVYGLNVLSCVQLQEIGLWIGFNQEPITNNGYIVDAGGSSSSV